MAGNLTNVYIFSLRRVQPDGALPIIEFAFKKYGDKTAFCVIDGIADLTIGINEEDEATG